MGKKKSSESTPPTVGSADAAPRTSLLGGFVSKPVLFLGLLVGLVSMAVDHLDAPISPVPYQYDYAPRTLQQQEAYETGVGRVPNSVVFDSAEHLLQGEILAPEDLVVSPDGTKMFTGLHDGRIVFLSEQNDNKLTMHEFGRTGEDLATCGSLESEPQCGRPLGMAFVDGEAYAKYLARIDNAKLFEHSKVLLIADAYKGLVLMDAQGKTTTVFDSVGARRVKFLNAIVVTKSGTLYMTESSARHARNQVLLDVLERQPSGRLLKFDPRTGRPVVLAKELGFPNGVQFASGDESALLIALTFQNKIVKFDLKSKKFEDFAYLPGMPDNLWIEKHAEKNDLLFVGLVGIEPKWKKIVTAPPKVRKFLSLVFPQNLLRQLASRHGTFATVDMATGDILNVYEDRDGSSKVVAGVHDFGDYYYLTSWVRTSLVRIPKSVFQ